MASTFVSLPKPFFAFPAKTNAASLANHKLLGTDKFETLVKCQAFNVLCRRLMICFVSCFLLQEVEEAV